MSDMTSQPRLLFPGLAGFYEKAAPIGYALMRLTIGIILFMHGWVKVNAGLGAITGYMSKQGLEPAVVFAAAAIFLETVGAICLAVGLFTRFFAAALAIELLIALLNVHLVNGFSVGNRGYEYVLLLGVVAFAISLRGGGPYSVDRMVGKEL